MTIVTRPGGIGLTERPGVIGLIDKDINRGTMSDSMPLRHNGDGTHGTLSVTIPSRSSIVQQTSENDQN